MVPLIEETNSTLNMSQVHLNQANSTEMNNRKEIILAKNVE